MGMYGFDNLDSVHSIDLTSLRKWGALRGNGQTGTIRWTRDGEERGAVAYETTIRGGASSSLRLLYTSTSRQGELHKMEYVVHLYSIPCRYGGNKWFFQCPNATCSRRCRILYEYSQYFVCRRCTGLWYDSQTYTENLYRPMQRLFDAGKLKETLKRHYYRGKQTRKYRRYLALTGGMDEQQQVVLEQSFLKKMLV